VCPSGVRSKKLVPPLAAIHVDLQGPGRDKVEVERTRRQGGRSRMPVGNVLMLRSLPVPPQVLKDKKVVQELPITALKKIQIGRREDADWIIEHPSGSRQHA
jgi:hypothetical protein